MTKRKRNKDYREALSRLEYFSKTRVHHFYLCFRMPGIITDYNNIKDNYPELDNMFPKNYTDSGDISNTNALENGIYHKKSMHTQISAKRANQIRATMLEFAIEMSK